jgi:DNA-binding PadR family transcriptional regulator
MFRYVVLGLLHGRRPRHGYALVKAYRERVGADVSTGNFYRDLQRLVAEGHVAVADRTETDDPRRMPYVITERGAAIFREWFVSATSVFVTNGHEDQLAIRLAFLAEVSPDDARHVLDFFQNELWARAKSLEHTREAALAQAARNGHREFPVLALMLARRLRRVSAELSFLEDLRATYEEWLETRPTTVAATASGDVLATKLRTPHATAAARSR